MEDIIKREIKGVNTDMKGWPNVRKDQIVPMCMHDRGNCLTILFH